MSKESLKTLPQEDKDHDKETWKETRAAVERMEELFERREKENQKEIEEVVDSGDINTKQGRIELARIILGVKNPTKEDLERVEEIVRRESRHIRETSNDPDILNPEEKGNTGES